ncbi:hypothetical protein AB0E63_26575 [Kribbella sp. NPDC026596]|uniref:hypothetical protein n=1 Tax=Kribbella sp. NPDC026596 TaxID=3155122 RepID=UPI003400A8F9
MTQQYTQPPHAQMPMQQPPKQKNTTKTALIIVGSIFGGLVLIGALGSIGGNKSADKPAAAPAATTTTAAPVQKAVPKTEAPKVVAPKTSAPPVKPTQPAAPKLACEGQDDRSAPCEVKVGSAFKLGSHTVLAGWKIKDSGFGMTIVGKAKNTDDKTSTMFIDVKFLKGDEVVAHVMCNTGDLEPGQSETMNCIPDGTYTKKFTKVTAEATF